MSPIFSRGFPIHKELTYTKNIFKPDLSRKPLFASGCQNAITLTCGRPLSRQGKEKINSGKKKKKEKSSSGSKLIRIKTDQKLLP
ncbi:MAG: hypothetical protein AB3K77_12330 [Methanosarcinaceae archaeon]